MQNSFQNAINMKSQYVFLHQQDSFENKVLMKEMRKYPLHIYMICRSPFICLDNEKTIIEEDRIELTFYTTPKGKRKELKIETINNPAARVGKIESNYPFNIIQAYKPNGDFHSYAKANHLLRILSQQNGEYYDELDFEVLYIGQAFGKSGERITIDRLKKHEKAQQIYFDTQQKFPDSEIWFLSFTFNPLLLSVFQSGNQFTKKAMNLELKKQEKVVTNPISLNQQITITEASLIKYFNTYEYNKEYLDFPSKTHKSYDECYKLDFNSTAFEIDVDCIYARLWSKSVKPSHIHYHSFFLHDDSDRKDMFKWFE